MSSPSLPLLCTGTGLSAGERGATAELAVGQTGKVQGAVGSATGHLAGCRRAGEWQQGDSLGGPGAAEDMALAGGFKATAL